MEPTDDLWDKDAPEVTMTELFGSDEDDDDVPQPEPKKRIPPARPRMKPSRLRSSVRSLLNHMRRRKKKVRSELAKFQNRVDTRWLANNRLKQRVRPVVANYTRAKKLLEGKKEINRKELLGYLNGLLERTVQLLRTQDQMRADLATLSTEASRTQSHVTEFMNSVLIAGKQALVEMPPFIPESSEVLAASFYQLRSCNRPIDPRKLFNRRSQAAAKNRAKEASGVIPDAAPLQPKVEQ